MEERSRITTLGEKRDSPRRIRNGLLKDGEYSSPVEGKRSLGSLIEEFDLSTTKFLSFGIRVTFKKKVPLKGLENVKLQATMDISNPRPQEGLNKIFSSNFKQPKVF
ncbi:hypothetical protein M9H77_06696 [Catharanthus roseus]|uniref:Uncharacterized protein n=1 Tax=Catharanthus roseus TaxID=4058 RepID=A0ACC0BT22_CATRO|nr:hypothetical protein M9H77_06696 [Catharanthus roseus]